jgi:chemotaxis family two-component system response regulator Rcp1
VVEDNKADVFLIKEAVAFHNLHVELHVVEDGKLAIDYINRAGEDADAPCPSLCLLDLNMPIHNGYEVLRHLRENERCKDIPVIIMTSSESSHDRAEMKRLGADAYFHKPLTYDDFLQIGDLIKTLLARR